MKFVTVIGARPQFVKAAMLSRALRPHAKEVLIHTGQHYDTNMSDIFFKQLRIPQPDYALSIGSDTHGRQTARMIADIERILLTEQPDGVIVYGDTNSTLAGALAAAKLQLPVAHVESGLRSYNRRMPEEINRVLTDHLSSLLFCPTDTAVANLAKEGIRSGVYQVGDIMYDAVRHFRRYALARTQLFRRLGIADAPYAAATIHRAENTDDANRLRSILTALRQAELPVVLPLHPRTRKCIREARLDGLLNGGAIVPCEPLPYLDMVALVARSALVLTDSGGVQKEAYMLKVPCLTLREETEWPETVEAGWNRLAGASADRILAAMQAQPTPAAHPPLFGDGRTAEAIARRLTASGQS